MKKCLVNLKLILRRLEIQALLIWLILCVPDNIVTITILVRDGLKATPFTVEQLSTNQNDDNVTDDNDTTIECAELKEDWAYWVHLSDYVVQGISVLAIGTNFCVIGVKRRKKPFESSYVISIKS